MKKLTLLAAMAVGLAGVAGANEVYYGPKHPAVQMMNADAKAAHPNWRCLWVTEYGDTYVVRNALSDPENTVLTTPQEAKSALIKLANQYRIPERRMVFHLNEKTPYVTYETHGPLNDQMLRLTVSGPESDGLYHLRTYACYTKNTRAKVKPY